MTLFSPHWSYSVHSVHFNPLQSNSGHSVHFGLIGLFGLLWFTLVLFSPHYFYSVHYDPVCLPWSYSVQFGPIRSILSILVLFVLIWSYLVHPVPIVDVTQILFTVTLNYFYFVNKISSSITFFFVITFGPLNFANWPITLQWYLAWPWRLE